MQRIRLWLDYLDRMGVRYSHSVHPVAQTALATANAERIPAHEFAKTVVYFGDNGYGIAVVPADQFVDLGKLGKLLRLSFIRLAGEAELAELFPDCELGAMPPFGNFFDMPVIIDAGVAEEFVAFTVGTHRDVVRMSFSDFQRLARPKVAAIVMQEVFA